MCDLCFVPKCDCDAALADSETVAPNAAAGNVVLNNPAPTATDVLALDSTQHWAGDTVRFGFPDTAAGFTGKSSYYSPFNEPGSRLDLSDFGRDSLRDGFARWDAVTALTIIEAAPGTTADINVGASSIPPTAWAYYPGGQAANGDIWFNTGQWFLGALASGPGPIIGSYAHATGMHEFGHALGLKHPHQVSSGGTAVLDADYDAVEFSIMSYRSYPGGPTGAYTVESWGYPQSPMMLDIAMIQRIYGADYGTLAGDTTYTVSTATGEMFVDGVSLGVPGANRVFRTVWDGNGTDHVDLSNYATDMHADLNPGRGIRFDTDGNFQAAKLAGGVHAGFNIYMSMLHTGDTRSLIENLTTGAGDDILIGNAADNVLNGGGGTNTVIYGGNSTDYVIDLQTGTVRSAATGTDTLVNVRYVQFDDVTLDVTGPDIHVDMPLLLEVNGTDYTVVEYAPERQGTGPVVIGDSGRSLTMTGDDWKAIQGSFTITADTVLRFNYSSAVEGEIHGIGFTRSGHEASLMLLNRATEGALFQIGGVTRNWGIENAVWDYAFGSGETTIEIAIGQYLTGTFDRMVFAMDDDAGRGSSGVFSDITFGSAAEIMPTPPPTPTLLEVNGTDYTVVEYAPERQGTGPVVIGDSGRSLTMTGDDWKAIQGSFTITADTVLRFNYSSAVEGEIHGIGFTRSGHEASLMLLNRATEGALFQIGGVTRNWGIENAVWDYAFGSGETTIEIAIGQYLTGTFDRMVFAMDDDAGRGSSGVFSDITFGSASVQGNLTGGVDRRASPEDIDIAAAIDLHKVDALDFYDIA